MQTEITVVERQGLLYVSDSAGREFPIPAGGSGNEAPPETGEGEGTTSTGEDEVQPSEGQQTQQGGQGFIEPYLEGVDDSIRPTVAEKLEQFRQDQDAQVTRRFEQLRNETEIPVTVYQHLINDPVGTVQWIAERFEQDRGVPLRDQLLEAWQQKVQEATNENGQNQPDPNQPLTQADIDRILEEREQQKIQEQQQQQQEQQRLQQQTQTVHSWMDDAAKTYGLEFSDADGQPDPLRTAIALQANELHNSGQARGKAAIEMVVESMAKRFGTTGAGSQEGEGNGKEPRTAKGGSTPPAKEINVADPKERRARMLELFSGGQ